MLPPLLADVSRQDAPTRRAVQTVLDEMMAELQPHFGAGPENTDRAYALLALMVGGMTLARAAADEKQSDRILDACRSLVDLVLEPSSSQQKPPANRSRARSRSLRKNQETDS
jgi:hypothetical protein